jgi:hypothetical protein
MEIAAQAFGCVPEAFVVALAGIWFSDGDPVRAYGVAAFGAFWAALGLVHSPKKLLALIAWALVVALLILECRFIIKQAPPNEPSVQKPASTTTPQTLTPAAPPAAPSAAPPVPASNTPEPPPAPQIISPEDAAIQLGAWSILLPRTNDLVLSYNAFDLALSQWESKAETEDGSAKLAKDLRDEAAKMVAASHRGR